jgi:hypothetical protein
MKDLINNHLQVFSRKLLRKKWIPVGELVIIYERSGVLINDINIIGFRT